MPGYYQMSIVYLASSHEYSVNFAYTKIQRNIEFFSEYITTDFIIKISSKFIVSIA